MVASYLNCLAEGRDVLPFERVVIDAKNLTTFQPEITVL
jgi:hypothetical protein